MSGELLAGGKVTLHCGDCIEILDTLDENSVDSVVCDPPYHLTSIVKRFGSDNAAPARVGQTGAYARASRGFMGKQWDGGDVAFRTDTWQRVLRLLKPGGHIIAFSGTRTYHRMATAIEDAGFEIRDQVGWAYGTGFPKSHDVSKGIDEHLFGEWIDADEKRTNSYRAEVAETKSINDPEVRRQALRDIDRKWKERGGFARKVTSTREMPDIRKQQLVNSASTIDRGSMEYAYTEAATPEAAEWEGWGTALKPSWEPCVLGRKPMVGTVAENVLAYGTGGLNIGACKIPGAKPDTTRGAGGQNGRFGPIDAQGRVEDDGKGRWPANIITDGSPEVLAAFPDTKSGELLPHHKKSGAGLSGTSTFAIRDRTGEAAAVYGDSGSAARFFYTAKADADDRLGSKHPTVKPVDLMQYFVRLVTPKGGTVLDCFAGTGTTGEAAYREGMRAVLIEREPEYQADIRRRMSLVLGGPDERRFAGIKASDKTENAGPLFSFEPPIEGSGGGGQTDIRGVRR